MTPEAMLDCVRFTLHYLREVNPPDTITYDHDEYAVTDVIDDLKRCESTLYVLVESRKVRPLCKAPAGFESMGLPRVALNQCDGVTA